MKLIGNLKRQVESENTMTGKKSLIEKAGMLLTDDELDKVVGGALEGRLKTEEELMAEWILAHDGDLTGFEEMMAERGRSVGN